MLVIETIGKVQNFQKAVAKIEGLEWLAEVDLDEIEIAEDVYDDETNQEKAKKEGGRFYLISSNQTAVGHLLRLWRKYQCTGSLPHGFGPWKNMFSHLHELRRWSEIDRLQETGVIDYWKNEVEMKKGTASEPVLFEIELHFRKSRDQSIPAESKVTELVRNMNGEVIKIVRIEDIAFHAMKVRLPIEQVARLVESAETKSYGNLIKDDAIKFFRPIPQQLTHDGESEHQMDLTLEPVNNEPPVIVMLDGLPLVNHSLLENQLVIDDPDGFAGDYPPEKRKHGTAMASLICHDDLNFLERKSLARKIYVRPIMKPDNWGNGEKISDEHFPEDLIERAVVRIFEGTDDFDSIGSVRVINISIGNANMLFLGQMSSWARLLDWLSWKYKVLFVVSAGNYTEPISIELNQSDVLFDNGDDFFERAIKAMSESIRNRKILAPAESMNALSVGAMHADCSTPPKDDVRVDIIKDTKFIAPYNRFGSGYRRSCKPDILVAGGRQFFTKSQTDNRVTLRPDARYTEPGQLTAFVGHRPEDLNNTAYTRGTSNAAALTTHAAGHIYEVLQELSADSADGIPEEYEALLIKSLLVHGASWKDMGEHLNILKKPENSMKFKRVISQYLGYGEADFSRVMECTAQRVTAIGFGKLSIKTRHRFVLTIPSACQNIHYQLIATLSYFTPINPFNFKYRAVKVFFECPLASGNRQESDWQQVQSGTVQHEILDLNDLDDRVEIEVQCNADADESIDDIAYALCLTLEAQQETAIDIYDAIKQEIAIAIPVPQD